MKEGLSEGREEGLHEGKKDYMKVCMEERPSDYMKEGRTVSRIKSSTKYPVSRNIPVRNIQSDCRDIL